MTDETPIAAELDFPLVPRRRFLQKCAAVAAATGLPGWMVETRLAAAAETAGKSAGSTLNRPHIALIGCGGMGTWDAKNAANFGDVVAVCDVDAERGAEAVKELTVGDKAPELVRDFRQIMANDDVDVVVNATPDHWHSLINIAAARAGKDIYAEKPLTLTVQEGRRVVQEVTQAGIVLQTGTQQRSSLRFRMAVDLVRSGRIGRLRKIDVWLPAGLRDGPFSPAVVPDNLNWDFWQGPAPMKAYTPKRTHGTFRFWYEYSGGTITDWGAHHIDIANWATGFVAPSRVEGRVLAEPIPGGFTTVPEYDITYTYPDGVGLNVHTTKADSIYGVPEIEEGQRNGILFTGSEGWLWVNRGQIKASTPEVLRRDRDSAARQQAQSGDHMGNFFDCVHSREDPICHAEVGHRSATMCHLGSIALRTRAPLQWDTDKEVFVGPNADIANPYLSMQLRAPFDMSFVG